MFTKIFYVVEEKCFPARFRYFARTHQLKDVESFAWELKEYGYETEAECKKEMKRLERYHKKYNFTHGEFSIRPFTLQFSSEKDYNLVKACHVTI